MRWQSPASFPGERRLALHLPGLACRACARRAEGVLCAVPGVIAAAVHRLRERADVRFDGARTTAREIAAAVERAGYRVAAARDADEARAGAIAVGMAIAALCNLVFLARAGEARGGVALRAALSAVAVGVAGAPLARRAIALLRQGILDHDALAAAAILASVAGGVLEIAEGARDPRGLVGAAAIAAAALGVRVAGDAIHAAAGRGVRAGGELARRLDARGREHAAVELMPGERVRLVEGQRAPADLALEGPARLVEDRAPGLLSARDAAAGELMPEGALLLSAEVVGRVTSERRERAAALDAEARAALARVAEARVRLPFGGWDDAALRGLFTAALGCAAFALVTHGFADGGVTSPGVARALLAAAAVLAGVSPAALMVAAPAARALAVARARLAGVIVKDPAALDALAQVDTVCFDEEIPLGRGDPALIALGARGLSALALAGLGPAEKALAIRDLQFAGARVLLVGDGHGAACAAQADVTAALARGALPAATAAPIVVAEGRLVDLAPLIDLARRLRWARALTLAIGAIYNAVIIPAAALGFVRPALAATLSTIEALLALSLASALVGARYRRGLE